MKDIKKMFNIATIGSIIMDVLAIVLGVFLVANPEIGDKAAVILIGIALVTFGIYAIMKFIMNSNRFFMVELCFGILNIIVGFIAIFKPIEVAKFIAVLTGIWILISAVSKLVLSIQFRKLNESSWIFDLSVALINMILGILLITNPFASSVGLTIYIGIMVIVYSGIDMVDQFLIRKRASVIANFLKNKNSVK